MKNNQITIKGILIFSMLIIISSFVLAVTGVIQNDYFYDSSTGNGLTNAQSLLYSCNDNSCSSIGTQIHSLNSGSNNYITFEYPYNPSSTDSSRDYYAHYIFKEGYLPKEYIESIWGYGITREYDYNFNKATSCHSPIDSFSIIKNNYANEPVVINMQATLEADAHSAFTNLELDYVPLGYEDYYSAETSITLEILNAFDDVVYTETKTYEIIMDTSQNVEFTWTPTTQGDYSARVTTNVIDCQCASSFTQFSERQFLVWAARPQNECYTIINNLEATPEFATQGDLVNIKFNKISNYADNFYTKTPVQTKVDYEITNNGNLVYSNTTTLNANSNGDDYQEISFQWTPNSGGDFNIKITGVCDSALCDFKTNPEDTAILGFFVESIPTYDVTFIVTDDSSVFLEGAIINFGTQTGTTNSVGEVVFESNTGNYNWQVSMAEYGAETGNIDVDSDAIINVQLTPIPGASITTVNLIYPNGGETLLGIINVLWEAINSLGNTLLINLDYSTDSGLNWVNLVSDETNDGAHELDTTILTDDDYLLRVCAEDQITSEVVCDIADSEFSIDNVVDDNVVDASVCGNNILETGEECDDGNTADRDGCSASCIIEDDDSKKSKKNSRFLIFNEPEPMKTTLPVITSDEEIKIINLRQSSEVSNTFKIILWILTVCIILLLTLLVILKSNNS